MASGPVAYSVEHRRKPSPPGLGALLLAERAPLLSGRDYAFAAVVTPGFTGMGWGELVGLEARYVRSNSVRRSGSGTSWT